jgi:uncharacterized protein (TIRG00374 family)
VAIGAAGYFAVGVALSLILHSLGVDIELHRVMFIVALSLLAGGLSMMPGGLGGTDVTMFVLLVEAGAPADMAFVATVTIRIGHLWFAVLIGLAALPVALKVSGR